MRKILGLLACIAAITVGHAASAPTPAPPVLEMVLVDYPDSEQHSSRIAPNGRWFAYVSSETGRQEIWVEPLPQTGKRYQLTKTGGRHPEWSPNGATLYYDDPRNQMYRVDVSTGAEMPKFGDSVALPIRGFVQGDLRCQYDLMPDGKAFLMMFAIGSSGR